MLVGAGGAREGLLVVGFAPRTAGLGRLEASTRPGTTVLRPADGTVVDEVGVWADGPGGDPASCAKVASTAWHWGDWQLPGIETVLEPGSGSSDAA